MAALKVGVFLPTLTKFEEVPYDVPAAARHAEDLGMESVWVVDQLVAGTGRPILDSAIALAGAAAATTRVRLGFGVLILPLRPAVWVAKQVASLQHLSGNRVILGAGAGGDRHERSWAAAEVPRRERGRRTDGALHVLPQLIAGRPTPIGAEGEAVQLAPGAPLPELLVGGMSAAAMARAARFGDGWLPIAGRAGVSQQARARLAELAAAQGRPAPSITAGVICVLTGDPTIPDRDRLFRSMSDEDGPYGIPGEQLPELVAWGGAEEIAAALAGLAEDGIERVLVDFPAGDWHRQCELLAEACSMLP